MNDLVPLAAMSFVFGIPLLAIWTSHRRKMLELQLQLRGQGANLSQGSVEALREEIRALRDTSTQYDVSFDAALQRMEGRLGSLERKVNAQETALQENRLEARG